MKTKKKRRKGKSKRDEIISYALHVDDPTRYVVLYRDADDIIECSLKEFLALEIVPRHRITLIKKGSRILYVKHGHCPTCGKKRDDKDCSHGNSSTASS